MALSWNTVWRLRRISSTPGDQLVSALPERNELLLDGFGDAHFDFGRQGVSGLGEVHAATCDQVDGLGAEQVVGDDPGLGVVGELEVGLLDDGR